MSSYKIISDTSCDINPSVISTDTIPRVPFYVSFDKENYKKEIAEISVDEFYRTIVEDKLFPKTSCPTISDYTDVFEPYLKDGLDILCFCISQLFSGSYQSAVNAADMMKEKYPERRIAVIDSVQATAGFGLIVYQANLMREAGYTMDEVIKVVEQLKHDAAIYFTVGSLDFLQNGGRIGKATALAGTLFNVKPVICMKEGELSPVENVRGVKKAVKAIIDRTDKEIQSHESDYLITTFFADKRVDITDTIVEHYSDSKYDFRDDLFRVGVTIGAHTGPQVIAIAFAKKYTLYEK
ncbi:MAG: DegV family protein [Clostridiales bacterium]|nr:DegV family protein [Clostridiales bacterium]